MNGLLHNGPAVRDGAATWSGSGGRVVTGGIGRTGRDRIVGPVETGRDSHRPTVRRRPRARGVRRPPVAPLPVSPLPGVAGAPSVPVERPYRMTRRARLAITLTVAAALVVVGVSLAMGGGSAPDWSGTVTHTVRSGESLWTIARSLAPDTDLRALVDEITAVNRLDTVVLQPGQRLLVPVR